MEKAMAENRYVNLAPESARARLASDLVLAGGLGFVSGVLPIDLANDRVTLAEFVEDQARKVLANLETILQPHGMTRHDVVSVRIHLVEFRRFHERLDEACAGFFAPGRLPARSVVGVSHLPRGALVAMDFVVSAP
jgi:enamine deaminase RidA (YjgF/YER057c/UK114 family)